MHRPLLCFDSCIRLLIRFSRICPKQTSYSRRHLSIPSSESTSTAQHRTSVGSRTASHYLLTNEASRRDLPRLQKVNAATGEATPFFDAAKMETAFAALPGVSAQDARQLANRGNYDLNPAETGVLINWSNDLFYYEFGSDRAIRLTSNPEEEVGEAFSPDGQMVSFVRENNLYVEDLSMQRRERALTRDGSAKILNGRLDWVYQEELYGRGNFGAYWWSPDSTSIAYLRFDESPVPEFTVVDHIPYHQNLEVTAYPKAGDPNPIVKLGVVNAAGGDIRWVDTYKYQPADLLISRVYLDTRQQESCLPGAESRTNFS